MSYNVAKLEQEQAYKKLESDRSVADAELRVQELELEIFRKSLAETKRIWRMLNGATARMVFTGIP